MKRHLVYENLHGLEVKPTSFTDMIKEMRPDSQCCGAE